MKKSFLLLFFISFYVLTYASFPVNLEVIEIVATENTKKFDFGGYLIGLVLGITGVLICYLIQDKDKIRSSWKGFTTRMVFLLCLVGMLIIYGNSYERENTNGYLW